MLNMVKANFGNPRLNTSQSSEDRTADFEIECMSRRDSYALFVLHQSLLRRYEALNGPSIDSQASAAFDAATSEPAKARPASDETFANKEQSHALFMLHQSLLSRYQALNEPPIDSQASAGIDFTVSEPAKARPASGKTFATKTKKDTQHV
jgi:hypothetical protein